MSASKPLFMCLASRICLGPQMSASLSSFLKAWCLRWHSQLPAMQQSLYASHQVSVPTCPCSHPWLSQAARLIHTRPYPRWWLSSCQVPWQCRWFVVSASGLWSVFAMHGQVSYQRQGTNFCQRFFRGQERVVGCPCRDVVKFDTATLLRCWLFQILQYLMNHQGQLQ